MIAQILNEPLKKSQPELFCQIKARMNISDVQAYRNAGYTDNKNSRHNAHRLATKDNVKARIEQIKAFRDRKVVVTPQTVALEAEDQRQLALANGDMKAANTALTIKAKAYGCQTDKVQTETTDTQKQLDRADASECSRIAALRLKESLRDAEPVSELNRVDLPGDTDYLNLSSQITQDHGLI